MSNKAKIIAGVAVAAAAGAVIGMLLAPDNGKELRKKLKKSFGSLTDNVMDAVTSGKQKIEELTKSVVKDASSIKDRVVGKSEEILDEARHAQSNIKSKNSAI